MRLPLEPNQAVNCASQASYAVADCELVEVCSEGWELLLCLAGAQQPDHTVLRWSVPPDGGADPLSACIADSKCGGSGPPARRRRGLFTLALRIPESVRGYEQLLMVVIGSRLEFRMLRRGYAGGRWFSPYTNPTRNRLP